MARAPKDVFLSDHYIRHNMRRLEHLASLGLPIHNRTVLELGAGIGDHTLFYLDRGCSVVSLDGRSENVSAARERLERFKSIYPDQTTDYRVFDLDEIESQSQDVADADIVHCCGILYHLQNPMPMLRWAHSKCKDILILETAVSPGDDEEMRQVKEDSAQASQALDGVGSRPTRAWVFNRLRRLFPYAYVPSTQPSHEEFPTDWRVSQLHGKPLIRAVFIASMRPLGQTALLDRLPAYQGQV